MHFTFSGLIFAYFGPETVLPMTSVVATVVGLLMMFGRNTLRVILRWRKAERPSPRRSEVPPQPHFVVRDTAQGAGQRR